MIKACSAGTSEFVPVTSRRGSALVNPLRVLQFSIRARALWSVNVNALTHRQADHAILFYH